MSLRRALELVTMAQDLLDARGGSPEAAAHLDLASACLRKALLDAQKNDSAEG